MTRLGIVSGTILLQKGDFFDHGEERRIETPFGPSWVLVTGGVVFISRHGTDPARHILPHRINHAANFSALQSLGVEEVIAAHSTGSLRRDLKPGTLVVPDDFIFLGSGPTTIAEKPIHVTPTLDEGVRRSWLEASRDCGVEAVNGGVYWQTAGPRFETRAEIRFMALAADLVGMTMAGEAIVAKELGMAYASLCSVDNYAHGIVEEPLRMDEIVRHARENSEIVVRIIKRYLERRGI